MNVPLVPTYATITALTHKVHISVAVAQDTPWILMETPAMV